MTNSEERISENNSVLFVDDESHVTDMALLVFQDVWDVFIANDKKSCLDLLAKEEIGVIVTDYVMPDIDGISLLKEIKSKYPDMRRVLLSANLNLDVTIDSINQAEVHKVLKKPWSRRPFIQAINYELDKYNAQKKRDSENFRLKDTDIQNGRGSEATDELLQLMFDLSTNSKIQDFTNQYINAIEGMKTLARLNAKLYFENEDQANLVFIMEHLSDMEVFANQYDQKILIMYLHLIRAYFFLYQQDYNNSMGFYKACQSIMRWLSTEYIDLKFIQYINEFPLFEDEYYNFVEEGISKPFISSHSKEKIASMIMELLDFEVDHLVSFSETLFRHYQEETTDVEYLIIVKEELPIYDRAKEGMEFELGLISGFVVALSHFLREVVKGSGDLDTIRHKHGIIVFHMVKDLNYVLLCSGEDVRYRIGLRQFAHETIEIANRIPKGYIADGKDKEILDKLSHRIFHI